MPQNESGKIKGNQMLTQVDFKGGRSSTHRHVDRQALKTYLMHRTLETMRETDPAMFQTLAAAVVKLDPAMLDL